MYFTEIVVTTIHTIVCHNIMFKLFQSLPNLNQLYPAILTDAINEMMIKMTKLVARLFGLNYNEIMQYDVYSCSAWDIWQCLDMTLILR